jgi:hypothetical protein
MLDARGADGVLGIWDGSSGRTADVPLAESGGTDLIGTGGAGRDSEQNLSTTNG